MGLNVKAVQKRARDLLISGQIIRQRVVNGRASKEEISRWLEQFTDLINDEDLQVDGNSKGIKYVSRADVDELWNLEYQIARLEKNREEKTA